jgi:hypothetical protein
MCDKPIKNNNVVVEVPNRYSLLEHSQLFVDMGAAICCHYDDFVPLVEEIPVIRTFAPYLECYNDNHILPFLTHASVEIRRYFKSVFQEESNICIFPPDFPTYMTPREKDELALFDAYFFLIKMSRAVALTYPQFSAHMRVLGDDIKRMYGSTMNTPEYVAVKNRRDYVICIVGSLELKKVDVSWPCECPEITPVADPIASLSAVPGGYVHYEKGVGVDNKHGQMKLLCVEARFLNHVLLNKTSFDSVLYLGSSPGDHIGALMKMFPAIRWFAYDLKPMIPWEGLDVIPNDEMGFRRLEKIFSPTKRRIVIINDIFVQNTTDFLRISDEYYDEVSKYCDIVFTMEKYFIEYTKSLTRVRIGAELWFQPYQGCSSFELRQVFNGRRGIEVRSMQELDNRAIAFRQEIRPNVYVDGRCYDCHYTDLVLKGCQAITGVDMSPGFKQVMMRVHKPPLVWDVMRRIGTKQRMKLNQKRGFLLKLPDGVKHISYEYIQTDSYDIFRCMDKIIRLPKDIPMKQQILLDPEPPEVISVASKVIVVNDDFAIKVAPYILSQDDFLEVHINGKFECLPVLADAGCIVCSTPGASFGPRLDLLGRLDLQCGCTFVKTGGLRKEFVTYEPPDLWDNLQDCFDLWSQ